MGQIKYRRLEFILCHPHVGRNPNICVTTCCLPGCYISRKMESEKELGLEPKCSNMNWKHVIWITVSKTPGLSFSLLNSTAAIPTLAPLLYYYVSIQCSLIPIIFFEHNHKKKWNKYHHTIWHVPNLRVRDIQSTTQR